MFTLSETPPPLPCIPPSSASSSSSLFSATLPVVMRDYCKVQLCSWGKFFCDPSCHVITDISCVLMCFCCMCTLFYKWFVAVFNHQGCVCVLYAAKLLQNKDLRSNVLSCFVRIFWLQLKVFTPQSIHTLSLSLIHQKVFTQCISTIQKLCLHGKARIQQKF